MPNNRLAFNALRIEDLSLSVHLGCTAEERAVAQEIRATVELRFLEIPKGTTTDSLQDTVCYAQISEAIRKHCESREFQLVERIGYEVYGIVRELTGPNVEVGISIHKVRPPVENLRGGIFYRCGDFPL